MRPCRKHAFLFKAGPGYEDVQRSKNKKIKKSPAVSFKYMLFVEVYCVVQTLKNT